MPARPAGGPRPFPPGDLARTLSTVNGTTHERAAQAVAVTAVTAPGVLFAHLVTTGVPAAVWATLAAILAITAVGASRPAGGGPRLALLAGAGQLAGHIVLALAVPTASGQPACLPAVGRGASLGLEYAVLRADGTCPAGTLPAGPTASATVAAIGVAVAVLAGNSFIACLGGILLRATAEVSGAARLVTGTIAAVLRGLAASLRALLRGVRLPARRLPLPDRRPVTVAVPPSQWRPGAALLRGPPTVPAAIA
jgi:hypothetical protein